VKGDHHGILSRITNTRRVLKNPLTAPGGTVEVDRHRATNPSMSSNWCPALSPFDDHFRWILFYTGPAHTKRLS